MWRLWGSSQGSFSQPWNAVDSCIWLKSSSTQERDWRAFLAHRHLFKPICCLSSHNRCHVRLTLGQVGWLRGPGFHHDLVEGPQRFGSARSCNKGCFCCLHPATGQLKCQESCSQPCREILGNQNMLQVLGDSHCCHGRTSFLPQHPRQTPGQGTT